MNNFNFEGNKLLQNALMMQQSGCAFQYYEDDEYDGRTITVNGKKLLHLASCSYLGLETNSNLINGAIEAAKKYGVQNSMSRAMLSSPLYKEFEGYLNQIFPGYQAVYPTVTLAHCSALPTLIDAKDAIILDAYVHNSVRMACQLCKANGTFTIVTKHNDFDYLKYLIFRLKKEGYKNIWYCADGVYSIHGNLCNINELYKLLDTEDNFYAYIDDAHGISWTGKNGSGYAIGSYSLHEKAIIVASFNKSFAGSGGGLISKDPKIAKMLGLTGQTMIFSGPIHPPMLGALIESAKIHLSSDLDTYQNELIELIRFFRSRSEEMNLPIVTQNNTPIQLLNTGKLEITNNILKKLIKSGFFAMAVGHPAIAEGSEGIRITLTRHLSKKDVNSFLECLRETIESEKKHM